MRYLLLAIHLCSAAMTVVYILITLLQAVCRSGNVASSRLWAIFTSLSVVSSGLLLTFFSGHSFGVFCLQASGIIIGVAASYFLLDKRLVATENA